MNKTGVPLSWITPNGVELTQHYLKTKERKMAIRLFGVTRKMVLKETTDKLNTCKQNQAIIPNIIHSLDASHLIGIINSSMNSFGPIITVHDCFGTLPNNMASLIFKVKKEFILLYTDNIFLIKFHDRLLQSLIDHNLELVYDEKNIAIKVALPLRNKMIFLDIPQLPKIGKLDLNKIYNSTYIIS
uniref:DNA-directed RNA polymerase n=1 Tax=Cantharellus appalachiensis TaxID=409893 RepID=A0A2S0S455_9AGAM|nr:hypothetical protein [Cantharellus appalachiensis]AWA82121.1 hypothetical protein [Cantharellus appalachiensis]